MNRAEGGAPTWPGLGDVDELVDEVPVVLAAASAVSRPGGSLGGQYGAGGK